MSLIFFRYLVNKTLDYYFHWDVLWLNILKNWSCYLMRLFHLSFEQNVTDKENTEAGKCRRCCKNVQTNQNSDPRQRMNIRHDPCPFQAFVVQKALNPISHDIVTDGQNSAHENQRLKISTCIIPNCNITNSASLPFPSFRSLGFLNASSYWIFE